MKKIIHFCCMFGWLILSACDLQPKIMSLPDSVGDFITTRYPALLADPETDPDIYNSAATDYGVFASPEMYGTTKETADPNDYLLYASVDDYTRPPAANVNPPVTAAAIETAPDPTVDDYLQIPIYDPSARQISDVTVAAGDTLYSLSRKHGVSVDDLIAINGMKAPYSLRVGQKLKVLKTQEMITVETKSKIKNEPVKTDLINVSVGAGDTLYSLSRKYSVPVNDLAVINKLAPPFALSVGQHLKVPVVVIDKAAVAARAATNAVPGIKPAAGSSQPSVPKTTKPTAPTATPKPVQIVKQPAKISSDPKQKLPAIAKRSGSKFSWPVHGTILSSYGKKSNGLFNDGINISAARGTKISAAENGVVAYAGNEVKGMGNLVIVQHSDGWMTVYAHMDRMSVRRGVKVKVGQQIGTVGQTGKVDRSQLHFEIRKGTKAYDPSAYLKK